jgi:cytoskeletal protein RodZ
MVEETENPEKSQAPKAGVLIREARIAAGVEAADLCASLRISSAALQALESGQYHRLPGEPYVRALLGSIARYLGLDPLKLLNVYSLETGTAPTEPSVAPYQDVSQVHVLAHRKLFIALLAILLLGLLLILAKVNSSWGKNPTSSPTSSPSDSLTVALPATDSMPVGGGLQPDSTGKVSDSSTKKSATSDTGHVAASIDSTPKPTGMHKGMPPLLKAPSDSGVKPTSVKAPETLNSVKITALFDTAVFRVIRSHKTEMVEALAQGQQIEVTHSDTIIVIQRKAKSVQVSFGDTTVVPTRKRFKVMGRKLSYF